MSALIPVVAVLAAGYVLTRPRKAKALPSQAAEPAHHVGVRSSDPLAEGRSQAKAIAEAAIMSLFTAPYAMLKTIAAQKGLEIRPPSIVASEAVGGPDTYTVFLSVQFDSIMHDKVVTQTKRTTIVVKSGKVATIDGRQIPGGAL